MTARLRHLRHRELDGINRSRLDKTKTDLGLGNYEGDISEYAVASVTSASDLFTITGEDTLADNLPRCFLFGDDIPAPLENGAIYWLFDVGVNQYSVAASKEEADAGTAITLTDDGTGVITLAIFEIDNQV